jgi:hypothetical protein
MDAASVAQVLLILAVAGVLYDRFIVDIIETQQPPLGVTAWEVVGGVLFTLVGFAFLAGVEAFLLALLCFAASGIPMILGSRARHMGLEHEG